MVQYFIDGGAFMWPILFALLFGLAFLAPLSVQVLAIFHITKVGGIDTWPIALAVFGAWGGVATWKGRWI